MFGRLFGLLGNHLGKSVGGGILSTIGRLSGKIIGNYVDKKLFFEGKDSKYKAETNEYFHLDRQQATPNIHIPTEVYGQTIPLIFGKARTSASLIWVGKIKHKQVKYDLHKGVRVISIHHYEENSYYISFALALCEGPISGIGKVFWGDKVLNIDKYNYKLYLGTEDQIADPVISDAEGLDKVPAFRGLAYIVFYDVPLKDFYSHLPSLEFEVIRSSSFPNSSTSLGDLIRGTIILPGIGEFVLDPNIIYKHTSSLNNKTPHNEFVNYHTNHKVANSVVSLEDLLSQCRKLQWAAPVVSWFANNLDAGQCSILPAVEHKDFYSTISEEWKIGEYTRNSASLISREKDQSLRYGGSINDNSVVRYLELLRSKNLKIMLYPILMLDIPGKPWRGHITCAAKEVAKFFRGGDNFSADTPKKGSYNAFIIHYAKLCKGRVDAFIIGSEFKGLTQIQDQNNQFPAVNEFINLAKVVRSILGPNVAISYAADWSEYHHVETNTGFWYNMDPLWACEAIDFIGIDAYFPLTRSKNSNIEVEEIRKGWCSGEGYDYYIQSGKKILYDNPKYAWKNIDHWWSTQHFNPDNSPSPLKPKMKKIWFTEFGFPSIDKATNQPNVFYDPSSNDGGVPLYSDGEVDIAIQKKAIYATLDYWKNSCMVVNMFLWAWDARPYPTWPISSYWKDRGLWATGHWINGKLANSWLADIITEICYKASLDPKKLILNLEDKPVEGIFLDRKYRAIDVIHQLQCYAIFDVSGKEKDTLEFRSRGKNSSNLTISEKECLVLKEGISGVIHTQIHNRQILQAIELRYIDLNNNYRIGKCSYFEEAQNRHKKANLTLPIVLSSAYAEQVCKRIVKNALSEKMTFEFYLSIHYNYIRPSDLVILVEREYKYYVRVISVKYQNFLLIVSAILEDTASYYLHHTPSLTCSDNFEATKLLVFEVAALPNLHTLYNIVCVAYQSANSNSLLVKQNSEDKYKKVGLVQGNSIIGILLSIQDNASTNLLVDELSTIIIHSFNKITQLSDTEFWQGKSFALLGNEIIRFKQVMYLGKNIYKLSYLTRGELGTERYIHSHKEGENFALLNENITVLNLNSNSETNCTECKNLYFKTYDDCLPQEISFKNLSAKPLAPVILYWKMKKKYLEIHWIARSKQFDNWQDSNKQEIISYETTLYLSGEKSYIETSQATQIKLRSCDYDLSQPIKFTIISISSEGKSSDIAELLINL